MGAVPTLEGGRTVCLRVNCCNRSLAQRCTLKPTSTMPNRMNLMVSGLVAFRNIMATALPGRNVFLPILRNKLRMFMVTSPKSILTGHGDSHLWHTVQ